MIKFIEATVVNNYNDNWNITFYFVAFAAIMISLFWTIYKMNKQEKKNNGNVKENTIYNKTEDLIENMDVFPRRKMKDKIENYYDIYQNQTKQNIEQDDNSTIEVEETKIEEKEISHEEEIDNENVNNDEPNTKEELEQALNKVEEEARNTVAKEKNASTKNTNKSQNNNKSRQNNKKKVKSKKKK